MKYQQRRHKGVNDDPDNPDATRGKSHPSRQRHTFEVRVPEAAQEATPNREACDMATNTDDPRPDEISTEQIATDLTLSNEEGTSWFGYGYDEASDRLMIDLYGDDGEIMKRYAATVTWEEVPVEG